MNAGIQLRVSDLVYAIRKRWKTIVVFTLIGLVLGIAASGVQYLQGSMSKNFRVTASAVFLPESANGTYYEKMEYPVYNDFLMAEEMTDTVMMIMQSNRLLNTVLAKSNLVGVRASDIKNNLTITQQGDTPVLEFTLNWRSSDEGVRIVSSLLSNGNVVLQDTLSTGKMSVIDQPAARKVVGGGLAAPLWGIMLVLGFCIGVGIVVLNMLLRPKLINLNDIPIETGLETLGVIAKDDAFFKSDESLLTRGSKSRIRQQFSSAAYIMMNRLGKKKANHVVFVTSATRREGRTAVACNLAVHIAATEKKVLLIDFDNQNPEVGREFLPQVDYEHSLNALYRGDIEEQEAIVHVNGYLDILPLVMEMNAVPLDKSTFDMLENMVSRYDYVIIDSPPVGVTSETLSLNQIADTALMVIGFDMATKMDIRSGIEKLDKSGCPIIGCIVNQEQGMENVQLLEKNARAHRRPADDETEDTMAKGMFRQMRQHKPGEDKSISYQLMTETFGKREEHTDDSEILEELIEFGLQEEDVEDSADDPLAGLMPHTKGASKPDPLADLVASARNNKEEEPEDSQEKPEEEPEAELDADSKEEVEETAKAGLTEEPEEVVEEETQEDSKEEPEAEPEEVEETPEAELQEEPEEKPQEKPEEEPQEESEEEVEEAPKKETEEEVQEEPEEELTEEAEETPEVESTDDSTAEIAEPAEAPIISEPEPIESPIEEPEEEPIVSEPEPQEEPMAEPIAEPTEAPTEDSIKELVEDPIAEKPEKPAEIPTQEPEETPIEETPESPAESPTEDPIEEEDPLPKALQAVFPISSGSGGRRFEGGRRR